MIRFTFPKAAPGAWPTLAALAAIYIALLGPFSCSAEGQTGKQAGVGFRPAPGTEVCSEQGDSRGRECYPIGLSARPFGESGNEQPRDGATLDRLMGERYRGGKPYENRQGTGFEADSFEQNGGALEAWFAEQPAAHKALWSGVPTTEEKTDVAHMESRRSSAFYDSYWWNAVRVEVNERNWVVYAPLMATHGITTPGIYTIRNPLGKLIIFEVMWTPGGSAPPPSPVPAPAPPPPPPPPTTPCTSWPISGWLEQCGRLAAKVGKELAGAELCGWCARKEPAPETALARLRGLVCEPVCEVVTPPPPVEPPPPPVRTCVEYRGTLYVPTIMSTGQLELVLVPQGEAPCP